MNEFSLPKKYAYCREVDGLSANNESLIRLYPDSPDTLALQVRTFDSITKYGCTGVKRNMIAGAKLSVDDVKAIRAALDEWLCGKETGVSA
jgi:hypothetical protein